MNILLNIGIVGILIAALCCLSPLVIIMTGIGWSEFIGLHDYVLIPISIGLIVSSLCTNQDKSRKGCAN